MSCYADLHTIPVSKAHPQGSSPLMGRVEDVGAVFTHSCIMVEKHVAQIYPINLLVTGKHNHSAGLAGMRSAEVEVRIW